MSAKEKGKGFYFGVALVFVVLLVINLRVAAGVGSSFERAVDGLVGGIVLLVAVFFAVRFFQCDKKACTGNQSCLEKTD